RLAPGSTGRPLMSGPAGGARSPTDAVVCGRLLCRRGGACRRQKGRTHVALLHPAPLAGGAGAVWRIAFHLYPVFHRARGPGALGGGRSEEHTSELQSRENLVCRLLLEKKKIT